MLVQDTSQRDEATMRYKGLEKEYLTQLFQKLLGPQVRLEDIEKAGRRSFRRQYVVGLAVILGAQFLWRAVFHSGSFAVNVVTRDALRTALIVTFVVPLFYAGWVVDHAAINDEQEDRWMLAAIVYSLVRFTTVGTIFAAAGAFWGAVYAALGSGAPGPVTLGSHVASDLTNGAIAGTFLACAYVAYNVSPIALALGARSVQGDYPIDDWLDRSARVKRGIGKAIIFPIWLAVKAIGIVIRYLRRVRRRSQSAT